MQGVITMVNDGWPTKQLSAMLSPGAFASVGNNLAPSGWNPLKDLPRALTNHLNEFQRSAILAALEGALPFTCIQVSHTQLS